MRTPKPNQVKADLIEPPPRSPWATWTNVMRCDEAWGMRHEAWDQMYMSSVYFCWSDHSKTHKIMRPLSACLMRRLSFINVRWVYQWAMSGIMFVCSICGDDEIFKLIRSTGQGVQSVQFMMMVNPMRPTTYRPTEEFMSTWAPWAPMSIELSNEQVMSHAEQNNLVAFPPHCSGLRCSINQPA